ncbi:GroEL-like apical domain-containing protein [Suillus spraguei]|nr:GroEL-like apical domain-containing protein [Suillus spraguei]
MSPSVLGIIFLIYHVLCLSKVHLIGGLELIKAKIHPTTIITGYRLTCREAVKFMQDHLNIKVDSLGRDALVNAAKTRCMDWVSGCPWIGSDLDLNVWYMTCGDIKYLVKAVNVLKAHGKSARESLYIQGYILNCTVASQAMKKCITNAKIACLDINLQKACMQLGVQIIIEDPNQLEEIRKQGIDYLCLKEFVKAGTMAVRRCRKEDLRCIAKTTDGILISSSTNLEGEEAYEASYLGSADKVIQECISNDELILIKGSGSVVPKGGVVESALSIYLTNFAITLVKQLAIAEFAAALLSIQKQLSVNAAKDSTDLLTKLTAYHHAVQNTPAGDPKKVLFLYGLDLMNGDVRDNVVAGVLEPTMSKVQSLNAYISLIITKPKPEADSHGH